MVNNIWIAGSIAAIFISKLIYIHLKKQRYTRKWIDGTEEEVKSDYENTARNFMYISIAIFFISVAIKVFVHFVVRV